MHRYSRFTGKKSWRLIPQNLKKLWRYFCYAGHLKNMKFLSAMSFAKLWIIRPCGSNKILTMALYGSSLCRCVFTWFCALRDRHTPCRKNDAIMTNYSNTHFESPFTSEYTDLQSPFPIQPIYIYFWEISTRNKISPNYYTISNTHNLIITKYWNNTVYLRVKLPYQPSLSRISTF